MATAVTATQLTSVPNNNGAAATQPVKEEIWSRILQEASSRNSESTQGSVLLLGNDRSGKSSLVFHLTNGEQTTPFPSVLMYNYITVHADPNGSYAYQLGSGTELGPSESANLPLWTFAGKEEMHPLLKFAFPPHLSKCVTLLCASLQHPGNILPSIRKWYRLVEEAIKKHYSPEEIEQAKQTQVRFWQEYVEPIESSMHVESGARIELDPVLLPPEPGVFEENCGAILIVVLMKCDYHTELSDEQLQKVQYHVRQFCLRHGAALFYTSEKEEKNTQLLSKYLAHRVFSLPFTHPAYIVEKDSVFVPAGWDSEQKLNIIKEAFGNLEVPILPQEEEFVPRDRSEQLEEVEDEQTFLQRLAASDSGASPKRGDAAASVNVAKPSVPLAQTGDTLASFFNSLLKKDSSMGQTSKGGAAKTTSSANEGSAEPPTGLPTSQAGEGAPPEEDEEESELSSAETTPRDDQAKKP